MIEFRKRDLPLLALRGLVVFPGMQVHFDVGREQSVKAVQAAMEADRKIFLVAQKDIRIDDPTPSELYQIGCIAEISQVIKISDNGLRVVVEGLHRAKICDTGEYDGSYEAEVEEIREDAGFAITPRHTALIEKVKKLFESYAASGPQMPKDIILNVAAADTASFLSDYISANIFFPIEEKQKLLETVDAYKRLEQLLFILSYRSRINRYEYELNELVQRNMDENQRDYYLREQLKVITEELGDGENLVEEAEAYREKIAELHFDEDVTERLLTEVSRFAKMPGHSPESAVVRTYLDTVLELPWNIYTKDNFDTQNAQKILDRDHYGLKTVKERIIETIAVRKLSKDVKGQIICLIGPPGVGKTSIAKSVAECLNRNFARVSLGGVHDESEIRGHRRTYIGSMPGRIIKAVNQAKSHNPVILMDEIDKLAGDYRGDPSAALLEVLDPEQNNTFCDHYLEIPFDLSDVLFIITANDDSTIPRALYDRMDVIYVDSYTYNEKFQIAKRHLIKKQMKHHGLTSSMFSVTDKALSDIINGYTKESGVRQLERIIAKLCRKADGKIVSGDAKKVGINSKNIEEYLGHKKYFNDTVSKSSVGLVNGLAWTSVGGEVMPLEAAVMEGSGKLILTGSLGDVMKESAQEALSFIRTNEKLLNTPEEFYKKLDIHVNAVEGAVPKDGPSAGIALIVSIISALSGCAVKSSVAMTGEITLLGRVLPIGGLKEKAIAAYKNGIKTVIIPKNNEPEIHEFDKEILDNVKFVPVSDVREVFGMVFANDKYLRKSVVESSKTLSQKPIAHNINTSSKSDVVIAN